MSHHLQGSIIPAPKLCCKPAIAIQCYQSLPPAPTPQKLRGQPPAPQKYPQHQPVNQLLSQNYHVIQGMLQLHPIGEINSSD